MLPDLNEMRYRKHLAQSRLLNHILIVLSGQDAGFLRWVTRVPGGEQACMAFWRRRCFLAWALG